MVAYFKLEDTIIFTGKVAIDDYLGIIDVIVLTSLSEAQPLVILEAGAAGIPSVATDVGACREMVLGKSTEMPPLGVGGIICPLSNPESIAKALTRLLTDKEYYQHCSIAMRMRVAKYYNKKDQYIAYRTLYDELIGQNRLQKAG